MLVQPYTNTHTHYSFILSTPLFFTCSRGQSIVMFKTNVSWNETLSASIPAKYLVTRFFNGEMLSLFRLAWAVCMGIRAFSVRKKGECIEQEITFYDIYYVYAVVVSIYFSHSVCLCVCEFCLCCATICFFPDCRMNINAHAILYMNRVAALLYENQMTLW